MCNPPRVDYGFGLLAQNCPPIRDTGEHRDEQHHYAVEQKVICGSIHALPLKKLKRPTFELTCERCASTASQVERVVRPHFICFLKDDN
jgi:hypothetical protein